MNVIHLIGRIATDLKIETTTTGKNVCNFNLAVNRIANNTTDFIPCRVWNTTADNLCRYKNKGEQSALEGSLVCSSYTDKDGQNKKSIYVLVNNIEYVGNKNIKILDDYGYEYAGSKAETEDYLSPTHIVRIGGELRVTPEWSLRAGCSYQTTNASQGVRDDDRFVAVGGCSPAFSYDRSVQNITAGFGYRHKNFYFDMAYVHKYRQNTYNAFPIDDNLHNVQWDVNDHNNRISATLGFRF